MDTERGDNSVSAVLISLIWSTEHQEMNYDCVLSGSLWQVQLNLKTTQPTAPSDLAQAAPGWSMPINPLAADGNKKG